VIAFNNRWIYLRAGRQILSITERGEVNTRWSVVSNISAPPTVGDDGTVYVASDDLNFSALDQRGKAIWTTKLDDVVIAPPLCTSDSIVICTNNGIIYSLDRSTGEKKWVYSIMPVFKSNIRGPRYAQVQIPPVVAGGNLYVLSDDGTLSAFRGDAPDDQSPVVNSLYPAPDDTISGVNIPWQIKVVDLGSGLKPSSPLLSVDGKDVPVEYDPATSSVHVKYVSNSSSIFKLPITLPTLSDGGHKAVLLLADWRGNTVAKIWQFTTDKNQLPPKNTAPAPKSLTNSNISQNSNIWALSDMGVSQPFDNAMLSLGGMFSPNMQGNAGGGGNGGSGGNGRSRGGGINGYGLPGPSQGTPSQGGGVLTITGTGTGGSGTTTVVTPPAPPK
jgi:outer membrane protein assembly factor BamB